MTAILLPLGITIGAVFVLLVIIEMILDRRRRRPVSWYSLTLALGAAFGTIAAVTAGWLVLADVDRFQLVSTGVAGALAGAAVIVREEMASRSRTAQNGKAGTHQKATTIRTTEGPVANGGNISLNGKYVAGHDMIISDTRDDDGPR